MVAFLYFKNTRSKTGHLLHKSRLCDFDIHTPPSISLCSNRVYLGLAQCMYLYDLQLKLSLKFCVI